MISHGPQTTGNYKGAINKWRGALKAKCQDMGSRIEKNKEMTSLGSKEGSPFCKGAEEQMMPRSFDKASKKQIISKSPEIIHNPCKCMYV